MVAGCQQHAGAGAMRDVGKGWRVQEQSWLHGKQLCQVLQKVPTPRPQGEESIAF